MVGGSVQSIYLVLSIPFFFLFLALEAWTSYATEKNFYRFGDTIANLSCGMVQAVTDVFFKFALFFPYVYLYEHSPIRWKNPFVVWGLALVGVDFFYYWWHRASHRVSFIWAAHEVHHQSQEYNLSVALRQSSFSGLTSWPFYLPLAILGVPPEIFLASATFSLVYQFWIHTRLIKSLGPVEWIFNTPSHHRVHHASNAKYIDRNYAGTLIVWDKAFGTFLKEDDEPLYGTVPVLRSWNPVWANLSGWKKLGERSKALQGLDKLLVWVMPPEWKLPPIDEDLTKYDVRLSTAKRWSLAIAYASLSVLTMAYLLRLPSLTWTEVTLYVAIVLVVLRGIAWVLETSAERFARDKSGPGTTISPAIDLR